MGVSTTLLTDAAIRAISGPKVFERGRTYAASGAVRISEKPRAGKERIHATIHGTEAYTTELWVEGDAIVGNCSCPFHGFCKHQVALSLVWRDHLAGATPAVDEAARRKVQASARRAQTQRERRAALHEFLHAQPAGALAARLIDLADHFNEIDRELRAWQKVASIATTPEELRTLISEALAIRGGFLPWAQVPGWLRQAEVILPLLRSARERDAAAGAGVALHALRRCWAAMLKADDSSGAIGNLWQTLAAEWLACLRATAPQPAAFGDTWLRVQLEDPFGCFDTEVVEQVMGAVALARYHTVLAAEWNKAIKSRGVSKPTARRAANPFVDETDSRLRTVERLHVAALEKTGDIDGALAVLRTDASAPHRCREVTRFLEAHWRLREAFASAEDAYRRFPDDWQVEADLLRAYERDGWFEEAHAMRRRQFEARPDAQRYALTLKSGIEAGHDRDALRAGLFRFMEQLEDQHMRATPSRLMGPQERELAGRRNVSLRAQVLLTEQRMDEALQLVQPPTVCHPKVLQEIALGLGKKQHAAAVELLQRVIELEMRTAQTPYREALALVTQIAARLDATSRRSWLAQLRVDFKARRNFVRDLPEG